MRGAAIAQIVVGGLLTLWVGGLLVFGVASGRADGLGNLAGPTAIAALSAGFVVAGVMHLKHPGGRGGALGLLLVLPFVYAVASMRDFESEGFVFGAVPGTYFFVMSLLCGLHARRVRSQATA